MSSSQICSSFFQVADVDEHASIKKCIKKEMADSSVKILQKIQTACEITAAKNTHMEFRQCEHTPDMEASC